MKLSDFELEVMQVIWDGKETAPEIHRTIEKRRKVAYSTVKTIIDRLEDKGAVQRVKQYGRTILYAPLIARENYSKPMVKSFINNLFHGNVRPLLNHIFQEEELSLEDVSYIEGILNEKRKELKRDDK